jgi:hypothetical protein
MDMATNLMLPDGFAPSNLHLRSSVKVRYIDGDMFNICERLAEIDPRLFIVELSDDEVDGAKYVIMEHCDDGVARMAIPERLKELDARVLERVQYILNVPWEHRLAAIEAENEAYEKAHHEQILDEMYEKMGGQFRWQLEHDGFITHRGVSYAKKGVAQPGKHR